MGIVPHWRRYVVAGLLVISGVLAVSIASCRSDHWAYGRADNGPNEHRHADGSITVP